MDGWMGAWMDGWMNACDNRILESIELNEIDYWLGFVVEVGKDKIVVYGIWTMQKSRAEHTNVQY